ncbi:hypothetical protein BHE74_00020074 [Ensete ventricosum]|nr:hypothetical protein BHE74_00020074 [Ensete ventricosum]
MKTRGLHLDRVELKRTRSRAVYLGMKTLGREEALAKASPDRSVPRYKNHDPGKRHRNGGSGVEGSGASFHPVNVILMVISNVSKFLYRSPTLPQLRMSIMRKKYIATSYDPFTAVLTLCFNGLPHDSDDMDEL